MYLPQFFSLRVFSALLVWTTVSVGVGYGLRGASVVSSDELLGTTLRDPDKSLPVHQSSLGLQRRGEYTQSVASSS